MMNWGRKTQAYVYVLAGVLTLLFLSGCRIESGGDQKKQSGFKKVPKEKRVAEAIALEIEKTIDPAVGRVPRERLFKAYEYLYQLEAGQQRAALPGFSWREEGPFNVSGRARTALFNPADSTGRSVFAAGVGGGLWKTTNIFEAEPDWTAVNDLFDNLAITCITADPNNAQTLYFGTGEGYMNADAIAGLGIFKSTDGGDSWNSLPSTTSGTAFYFNHRIAVTDSGTVLAATRLGGLQRSTDGGATWTKVLGNGMVAGATSDRCFDVDVDVNGKIFATLMGSIHISTDDGATFGPAVSLPVSADRIELDVSVSDPNYVYALVERNNGLEAFIRSTDGGTTWSTRNEPNDADPGISANDFTRGQGWYNLTLAVDPNDRDRVFAGGIDLFYTADGGGAWNQVSHWYGGFGQQLVHADQHFIQFAPNSSDTILFTNDGGIYLSENASSPGPDIDPRKVNFNVTQFYGCAMHPAANTTYFLAGAQDNGTQKFREVTPGFTREATGGDGAFCHIDQDEPQFQFTQYVYNNYFRSTDGGKTFSSISANNNGRFINPTDYDDQENILYAANGNNNYLRWDDPQTGNSFTTVAVSPFGGRPTSVTCSPNVPHRVYFGFGNGKIFRVDSAHSSPVSVEISNGLPNRYIGSVSVEEGVENHLLATITNYGSPSVFESTDGGSNWVNIEGNLPDMPVRWGIFNPLDGTQALIATELGVWTTDSIAGAGTVWGPANTGLANVRTDMLQTRPSDNLVIAATHGRGLFSSDYFTNVNARFTVDRKVVYTGKAVSFSDLSYKATSWEWDFGDGSPVGTDKNPTHIYGSPGDYTVSLVINGGASGDTLVNLIRVLPDLGTPYMDASGGNLEVNAEHFGSESIDGSVWERGSSSVLGKQGTYSGANAYVTDLAGAEYVSNTAAFLYGPCFNMTAAGTYTFQFFSRFKTEADYDGFRVEYSLDKGDNWTPLGSAGPGWYNFANTSENTAFPINEPYFAGDSSATYRQYSQDVSFLAGNSNVAFRFAFQSDGYVTDAGVALDNIELIGPPNNSNPFPVEWSPLEGAWVQEDIVLTWKTYLEENNSGFEIQRSEDGEVFEKLGFIEGRLQSSRERSYSWTDDQVQKDRYFYRLRQVDLDGQDMYSNTVLLTRSSPGETGIQNVFPSPFADHFSVSLHPSVSGEVQIELINLAGQVVWKTRGQVDAGADLYLQPGIGLDAGVYFLRIITPGQAFVKKVTHL